MSTKKPRTNFPPQDKISLYEKLIATIPGTEYKGATMPYTSLNGNMFSFIDKLGSCVIRLPEKEREEFLKKPACRQAGTNRGGGHTYLICCKFDLMPESFFE